MNLKVFKFTKNFMKYFSKYYTTEIFKDKMFDDPTMNFMFKMSICFNAYLLLGTEMKKEMQAVRAAEASLLLFGMGLKDTPTGIDN